MEDQTITGCHSARYLIRISSLHCVRPRFYLYSLQALLRCKKSHTWHYLLRFTEQWYGLVQLGPALSSSSCLPGYGSVLPSPYLSEELSSSHFGKKNSPPVYSQRFSIAYHLPQLPLFKVLRYGSGRLYTTPRLMQLGTPSHNVGSKIDTIKPLTLTKLE